MNSNHYLVSIITPAYNCVGTIKETYESIKSQTYSQWEWIIVEDHSNDNSFNFIKKLVSGDSRVVLLQTNKNSGAAAARNVGINYAKGRFMAFLDADDLWLENKLEQQIQFMIENDYALTYSNYYLLYRDNKKKAFKLKSDFASYKTLLRKNDMGCLTVMYDTNKIGKLYMPLDCEKREDYGAWLDATRDGLIAHRLNALLSVYRIGSSSVSSNKIRMIKYQYRVYRKHEHFSSIKSIWFVILCILNKLFRKY